VREGIQILREIVSYGGIIRLVASKTRDKAYWHLTDILNLSFTVKNVVKQFTFYAVLNATVKI
jgi:hypothetical protein